MNKKRQKNKSISVPDEGENENIGYTLTCGFLIWGIIIQLIILYAIASILHY